MVNRLIFLLLILPLLLFSAEFTASVSQNPVNVRESFILNLTLEGASAKGTPSIDKLKKSFFIHSQQQSFNSVMINGEVTSSTSWKFTLSPQTEGKVEIPAFSVNTSAGILLTEPLTMQVIKGTHTTDSTSPEANDVLLTTQISKTDPYKNEPVTYTIRISSKRDLANLALPTFNLENAIVETNGEAKIYKKVVNGTPMSIIDIEYIITPLKAGLLTIPSLTLQGMIPIQRKARHGFSFDDDFDLFSRIQGFDRLKPLTLETEEIVVDVQPAIAGMYPWLPVQSVTIEEMWNESQTLQVGEPITRSFKIVAEGIRSSQLPSFNELQASDSFFKIYADKPELGEEGKNGSVKSYRKEQYTLIPQQAGSLTLPELSIDWWDVTKKEKIVTRLPSRTLQVLPALEATLNNHRLPAREEELTIPEAHRVLIQQDRRLYALIGGLVILLIAVICWGITLQKKIHQLKEIAAHVNPREKYAPQTKTNLTVKNQSEKLPDLNPT